MPLYNYKCTECAHEFEKLLVKYDTDAQQECPKCGKPADFQLPLGSRDGVKFLFNYMAPDA